MDPAEAARLAKVRNIGIAVSIDHCLVSYLSAKNGTDLSQKNRHILIPEKPPAPSASSSTLAVSKKFTKLGARTP
jgi:hypothetical protein